MTFNEVPALPALNLNEARLKRHLSAHLSKLGFSQAADGVLSLPGTSKDVVRTLHSGQRAERLAGHSAFLKTSKDRLLPSFASGEEITPEKIRLRLIRVRSDTVESSLFRLATMTWSVPVSVGFGRRLRYLVWDEGHNRLAGVFALGDPVFNMAVRDSAIGWNVNDRSSRLVNVLDAYVLGAVPPYNMLLGGKVVACLIRSQEVYRDFQQAYGNCVGIISKEAKEARLLLVSTTSSMGRSSIYNRLKLDGTTYFSPIGYTTGWGHFHINDDLFAQMRTYLRSIDHRYADQHGFGKGPNWRLRVIRACLDDLGFNPAILKHGVKRQVFLCPFAGNAFELLRDGSGTPDCSTLRSVEEISELALNRWILPRAQTRPEFRDWVRDQIIDLVHSGVSWPDTADSEAMAEVGVG